MPPMLATVSSACMVSDMKKPSGMRQERPCTCSARAARAGSIAPACGRFCPGDRARRGASCSSHCPPARARRDHPGASCPGTRRRAQGACRTSGLGGGRPACRRVRAPRVRVLEPRRLRFAASICGDAERAPRVRVLEPRRPAKTARSHGHPTAVLFLPARLRVPGFGIAGGTGEYSPFIAAMCLHAGRAREPLASAGPPPQYEQDPVPHTSASLSTALRIVVGTATKRPVPTAAAAKLGSAAGGRRRAHP